MDKQIRKKLKSILSDNGLDIALIELKGEDYNVYYQKILHTFLKLKEVVDNDKNWHK